MEMGQKIHELRLDKKMTLEDLGNKVGVGKSTVRKWENGMIANMRRDKIAKLADALQTSPAYLMGWDDNQEHVIHKNLAYLIRRDNVTLDKLSKETDIDIDRLQAIYNDEENPIVSETKAIADYFGVTNMQLMKEKLYENIIKTQEHYASKEENEILCMIRELNNEGQNKVIEYIKDLSDKYRK